MRKLIIVLMLVALLAGCAKPPEPTATNTPEPTSTPTATPEPTYTPTPTEDPRAELMLLYRDKTVEVFNNAYDTDSFKCESLWQDDAEFKVTCKAYDNRFDEAILLMLSHRIVDGFGVAFTEKPLSEAVPEDFVFTLIYMTELGLNQVMSKTPLETLTRMADGIITTQIEWEQEAEIIK